MHKVQVGVVLDRTLFLHLAGRSITLEDISVADPVKYASCKKILEMDAAEIDSLYLTFSRGAHELGTEKVIDLCPGGQDISVNIRNREHYIDLLIKNIFVDSISSQLTHFTEGFADILVNPKRRGEFFECLDLEDLDRLLGGNNNAINLQDWKSHTQYNGYKEKDRQITLFWKVRCIICVNAFNHELYVCCTAIHFDHFHFFFMCAQFLMATYYFSLNSVRFCSKTPIISADRLGLCMWYQSCGHNPNINVCVNSIIHL
jgi:hypothetical protein